MAHSFAQPIDASHFDRLAFRRIQLDAQRAELLELHERVARLRGRIELHAEDGSVSVLISGDELHALETALRILSETDDGRAMQRTVKQAALLSA